MEDKVREFFNTQFSDINATELVFRGMQSFTIPADQLYAVCDALINDTDLQCRYLAEITVVDWLGHENAADGRYEVIYIIASLKKPYRFMLKVHLDSDTPTIRSLIDLWEGANWLEREVYDMFGIMFEGHPDMSKLLTADELDGHPLRRDFPLTWEQPKFTWNVDDPPEVIK